MVIGGSGATDDNTTTGDTTVGGATVDGATLAEADNWWNDK
ncbi:hypothetical protein [Kosmotoga arenicorallina]|nr:hypothetical protein [Kosmotoga arenicorallina]